MGPKTKFAYAPWRVEATPGELLVVDARDMVVNSFSTDLEDLENISLNQVKERAYGFAALPLIYEKARAFLDALSDPVKQLDENALFACSEELEAALLSAKVPTAPEKPTPPTPDRPPPLGERETLRERRKEREQNRG